MYIIFLYRTPGY